MALAASTSQGGEPPGCSPAAGGRGAAGAPRGWRRSSRCSSPRSCSAAARAPERRGAGEPARRIVGKQSGHGGKRRRGERPRGERADHDGAGPCAENRLRREQPARLAALDRRRAGLLPPQRPGHRDHLHAFGADAAGGDARQGDSDRPDRLHRHGPGPRGRLRRGAVRRRLGQADRLHGRQREHPHTAGATRQEDRHHRDRRRRLGPRRDGSPEVWARRPARRHHLRRPRRRDAARPGRARRRRRRHPARHVARRHAAPAGLQHLGPRRARRGGDRSRPSSSRRRSSRPSPSSSSASCAAWPRRSTS